MPDLVEDEDEEPMGYSITIPKDVVLEANPSGVHRLVRREDVKYGSK